MASLSSELPSSLVASQALFLAGTDRIGSLSTFCLPQRQESTRWGRHVTSQDCASGYRCPPWPKPLSASWPSPTRHWDAEVFDDGPVQPFAVREGKEAVI